jgi:hypothetical protein
LRLLFAQRIHFAFLRFGAARGSAPTMTAFNSKAVVWGLKKRAFSKA